ncbi:MAG: hypothetical protein U0871_22360 [Gemmataceae bacterium]
MTTITILPADPAGFRAVAGGVESAGPTVGQALDGLAGRLPDAGTTLVVIQPMTGDDFFPEADRKRLAGLMARWRAARDAGGNLPPAEQTELDALVAAELRAATARAAALQ